MNRQFDIIIIGDSKDGNEAVKQLAKCASIKIAFVSDTFKSTTTRDFINVEYIKDRAVFIDYKNRLFGCYLKSGDRLYCTHLIVAAGLQYEPLIVNHKIVPNVFNTAADIGKLAKNQQAVVLGNTDIEAKLALTIAKKYKYVYLCSDTIDLKTTEATAKKLAIAKNIVVLLNTSVMNVTTSNGELKSVELDNYATVTCSAIFVKTVAKPDTDFISTKFIEKDTYGYLKTTANLESQLIPKCFATGSCTCKNNKKMTQAMIDTILKDFMEGCT
jgi:thioredoxin reductase